MALLTSILNIHLNIGQQFLIDTAEVYMWTKITSIKSILHQPIEPMGNARIQIPINFNSNIDQNTRITFRVCGKGFLGHRISLCFSIDNGTTISISG